MNTPFVSILLFLLASVFGAVGQFLYKSGTDAAGSSLMSYLLNWRILGGVVCYVAVMILFVAAFKRGGELSVLYPIYASTFIWAALIGLLAYGTQISFVNVGGMVLLIVGMCLMGWGHGVGTWGGDMGWGHGVGTWGGDMGWDMGWGH